MILAAVVALWHRAHLYKILVFVVFILIVLQYLLSSVLDRRSIETIFTVNSSRFLDHSARNHPHGLIIYGPVVVSANNNNNNINNNINNNNNNNNIVNNANVSSTTASAVALPQSFNNSSRLDIAPTMAIFSYNTTDDKSTIKHCPFTPPNLVGPLKVDLSPPDFSVMEKMLPDVKYGGFGSPAECTPRSRVAIIIPFRDRLQHLQTLLYNLHPILLRQQVEYQIFVIEQEGASQFNRASLMNVGYTEALKEKDFQCFVFHDVDLLPEDDRNLYTCPAQPRHMSVAVDKFRYRLPYADLFGGVSALTREHFLLVNGFSNVFWGWGGEDDDMANRIKAHGLHISRYPANIARYKMLVHKKEKANPKRYEFLKTGKKRFQTDGLSNLQYELVDKKKYKLYTWLLVKLTPPQPS